MRSVYLLLTAATVAACSPPVPDDTAGVGFGNYDDYQAAQAAREAELRRGSPQPVVTGPLAAEQVASGAPLSPAEQTAADAVAAIRPAQSVAPVQVAGAPVDRSEISDEQDFEAVSSRQTIASDAERRAQQSAQYTQVKPTAVPTRPSGSGAPTPIQFAIQVRHPVGQKVYSRSPFGAAKAAENCAAYASTDLAQDAFLQAGGPEKDKLKLDPDGDGYACGWNPAKYRQLARG